MKKLVLRICLLNFPPPSVYDMRTVRITFFKIYTLFDNSGDPDQPSGEAS